MRIKNILKKILPASFSKIDATKAEIISAINSYNVENIIQDTRGGYSIQGKNNSIVIVEEDGHERELTENERIKGLEIVINGSNNMIKLSRLSHFENATIFIDSSDSECIIKYTPLFKWYVKLAGGRFQKFNFGKNSYTNGTGECHILDDFGQVEIGDDCIFAFNTSIFGSDGHTVYDINTLEILNRPTTPVKIGNHCWICGWARFTKNAQVGNNCIIAQNSMVTKNFSAANNCLIGGNPAKIIRRNINWDKRCVRDFEKGLRDMVYDKDN